MELDWSVQSPHIRTLYRPWQPGNGCDEVTLQAAEEQLGFRLPTTLRTFYQAWGDCPDLTQGSKFVLRHPQYLVRGADALMFCRDDQQICSWGIRYEALQEDDPPVVIIYSKPSETWEVEEGLDWTLTHTHLSNFLDELTYLHAYGGGALHGAWTYPSLPDLPAEHLAWLEEHWSKATVGSLAFGRVPDPPSANCPTLYVCDGQAFWWRGGGILAARETGMVDDLAQRFQITWEGRW